MPRFVSEGAPQLLIGRVMHRRLRPTAHAFAYPVFYVQLPLRALERARCAVFSIDRPNLLSVHRCDHGPRDGGPLLPWVRRLLRERGLDDDVDVVLQCFPRVLGFVFDPVSFWYCRDRSGALVAVLAEVNNTFGGRHAYLLHNPDGAPLRNGQLLRADKAFHVSPFCRIEGAYGFRFHLDGPLQRVSIDYDDGAEIVLRTAIWGRRAGWGPRPLLGALVRMPLLTVGVVARIHWQALRLWRKGVPFQGARPAMPSAPGAHPEAHP